MGIVRYLLLFTLLSLVALPGCGGCRDEDPAAKKAAEKKKKEEELRRKKKEKKPDFEIATVEARPADRDRIMPRIKPGHWTNVHQAMKTNNFDFLGDVEASIVNKSREPIELDRTPFRLTTTRPAVLPKGQQKVLDMTLFVPHASRQFDVESTLRGRRSGHEIRQGGKLFAAMAPYEYYFVVLARSANQYAELKNKDAIRVPWQSGNMNLDAVTHYQVVFPELRRPVAVPTHPLAWTSTAYVLWDDVDPDLFTDEQQQAMLDWIHWGGQLLISGPDSLDTLRGSFLDPVLPASGGNSREISDDELAKLSEHWAVPEAGGRRVTLTATHPWSGVTLEPREGATEAPHTAGLVVERRAGRGRVLVSAFRLSDPDLTRWSSYESFLNSCLLARPRRRFAESEFLGVDAQWADVASPMTDPGLTSAMRYFTRDIANPTVYAVQSSEEFGDFGEVETTHRTFESTQAGGVASWNPMSPASEAARAALRQAAGIMVPESSFVVWVLAAYVTVLVPLNWLLFYAIGRVEWAWVAAPVIAVVCALVVIRLAQLDIGFVRSRTEIGVLETQGDYDRGHLTRYSALYTSLSTRYDIQFDSMTAVVQPFPKSRDYKVPFGEPHSTVTYRRYDEVHLDDVLIDSNSTGMFHSEEMVDLGGALKLGKTSTGAAIVINNSKFDIRGAAVQRRRTSGGASRVDVSWIGDLPAGKSAPLGYQPLSDETSPATRRGREAAASGELDLGDLWTLAEDTQHLEEGEVRLTGAIDTILPGSSTDPDGRQLRAVTLLVAHLQHAPRTTAKPDVNLRTSVVP